jgi:OFA family oxalate/formate antiporter-like MFS transporter
MLRKRKIFYGWWIVLASAVLNILAGGTFIYGFTAFFNPIRTTFGWSAAVTSIVFLFQRLEQGMLSPLAGFLVDRIGPRKMMLAGWTVVGLGFLLMSRINSLFSFYGSFIIIATGFSFGSFVVMNTAVAHWFREKRSRALTFIYVGFGVSGTLVPLAAMSIDKFGWRTTLTLIGIILLVAGTSLSSLMRHKPGQYGYLPDGKTEIATAGLANSADPSSAGKSTRQEASVTAAGVTVRLALRTRAFWLLSLVFLFQHLATSAVMVHIVPFLESVEVPTTLAATVVTGMTLCSLIGRLGFGFLGDFYNKRYLIAISVTVQTVGVLVFAFVAPNSTWLIIPFLLLYGPGYGGGIPLRPALQADYFGIQSFGTIMGLMSLPSMIGGLFSPVFAGWVYDVTGSYHMAWLIIALASIPAIPLILLARPPQVDQAT